MNKMFEGKKITVVGLGLLGRGVGDAKFLAENGADVIITDLKTEEQLAESVKQFPGMSNVKFSLGGHKMEDFENRDFILKAAGVPLDSPYIAHARERGIPIEMSTSLFCSLLPKGITTIGVTGTRGKTTTTYFIYEGLKRWLASAQASAEQRKNGSGPAFASASAWLGGNIQGVSTLAMLPEIKSGDFVVMELDSWQLQGFGEKNISPNISVFTTFYPDHLNYYKGDLDLYLNDKANIFINQKEGDTFVTGDQCVDIIKEKYSEKIKAKTIVTKVSDVPKDLNLKVIGEHNRYNIAMGMVVLRAIGLDEDVINETAENFKSVKGRLEHLATIKGVEVYNDTTSTTPIATVTALKALCGSVSLASGAPEAKLTEKEKLDKVVLIMGGADKSIDMKELIENWLPNVKKVILLPGTGTDRIKKEFDFAKIGIKAFQAFDLTDAVKEAFAISSEGGVVLFSPAFASFGHFKNEYDRGEQFDLLIEKILG